MSHCHTNENQRVWLMNTVETGMLLQENELHSRIPGYAVGFGADIADFFQILGILHSPQF